MPDFKKILQIVISFACLGWVVTVMAEADWISAGGMSGHVAVGDLLVCLGLALSLYASRLVRLAIWAQHAGGRRLSVREWIELYLKSITFGSLTPARLGDFSRISLLKSTGLGLKERTRLVFYDKIFDLVYIPLAMVATAATLKERMSIDVQWIYGLGGLLLLIYATATFFFGGFLSLRDRALGYLITLAGLVLFVFSNYFLFRAAGVPMTPLEVAGITITVGVLANLPLSIGGIGVRESSLLVILAMFGVDANQATPVLLLEFGLNLIFPIALYGAWIVLGCAIRKLITLSKRFTVKIV